MLTEDQIEYLNKKLQNASPKIVDGKRVETDLNEIFSEDQVWEGMSGEEHQAYGRYMSMNSIEILGEPKIQFLRSDNQSRGIYI